MAQTPISASVAFNSSTPTTIYTVPGGATAVVKSVLSSSIVGGFPSVTINKVSSGVTYPIVVNTVTGYNNTTGTGYGYQGEATLNLLNGPITLAAGDSLSISTSTAASYKFPTNISPTTNPYQRISNIEYFNGTYVAVGSDTSTGYGLILTSTDAITWTKQTFNFAIDLADIAYDGTTNYVVVGRNNAGKLYYSTNLTSWTQQAAPNSSDMYCITFGNGKFVAGGAGGNTWYSNTSAPTAWTAFAANSGSAINTVLTIGTTWAFGSTGFYTYTTNFSTFITPYQFRYLGNAASQGAMDIDNAGKIFITNTTDSTINEPNGSLFQSTNQGASYTSINLTGLSPLPQSPIRPYCFGNGGYTTFMQTHDQGNSRYVRSSDGVTWVADNYTGTYGTTNTDFYGTNLYGALSTTRNTLFFCTSANQLLFTSVSTSGVLTETLAFLNTQTNVYGTGYGQFVPMGNHNSNSWVTASVSISNADQCAQFYGSNPSSGSNAQFAFNLYAINSWGFPNCGCSTPAASGYLLGTNTGYVMRSTSNTGGYGPQNGTVRPFGSTAIVGMVKGGQLATSRIVYINSAGQTAYSLDQGATWTVGGSIGSTFSAPYMGQGQPLFYNGGYFIAMDNAGALYYSTNAIEWFGNPTNIQYMDTVNSKNIMIRAAAGIAYTNGTSLDGFVFAAQTTDFGNFPSIRRIEYVNSTYVLGGQNSLVTSTDLSTFSATSLVNLQINNQLFVSPSGSSALSLAYSGTGNNLVVGAALRAPVADNVSISQPTALTSALSVGVTTAGIVQIS
jgi:hypothetical protein